MARCIIMQETGDRKWRDETARNFDRLRTIISSLPEAERQEAKVLLAKVEERVRILDYQCAI